VAKDISSLGSLVKMVILTSSLILGDELLD